MTPARPSVLANRTYRRLFCAQVVALVGTGLMTVALSLLAFDLEPAAAGAVVATALTIKMVAYVGVAPVVAAATARFAPRHVLVGADLIRVAVAACLPWVGEVWQIYVLIAVLQSASATFTPAFQAVLPVVLPHEDDYTRALSLSRLAYDLEAVVSPVLAAAALSVMSFHALFGFTAAGFGVSAILVATAGLAVAPRVVESSFWARATDGVRLFVRRPALRAVLALDVVVASASSLVLVGTVVVVREDLARGPAALAITLGAYGAGSMAVALGVPALLRRTTDRVVMLSGGLLASASLAAAMVAAGPRGGWAAVVAAWVLIGAAVSAMLTPVGRVVNRAVESHERPAAFAASFSLSHACFLVTYPLTGWTVSRFGAPVTAAVLGTIAVAASAAAVALWARAVAPRGTMAAMTSLDHPDRPDGARLREAADLFSMIGEPTRLELLWLLTEGPATAGELGEAVGASRTAVSQHLAKLRLAGLVAATRDGRHQVYEIRGGHVSRVIREGLNQADHAVTGEGPHQ